MKNDTVNLLKECDSGIKMGIDSIEAVLDHVESPEMKEFLDDYKREHDILKVDCKKMLSEFEEDEKSPPKIAESMSKLKINFQLAANESDQTISALMTDGCNMGTKSLSKYLNQYKNASEESRKLTNRIIKIEDDLAYKLRKYL